MIHNEHAGAYTNHQRLFIRYTYSVLVDLTVLNLFNEYWSNVYIETFSISLLTAIVLQVLLQATIALEHRVARHFLAQGGTSAKVKRLLATWGILFGSKLIILEILDFIFGDAMAFSGALHGVVAFIVVVIAIIIVEEAIRAIYRSLGGKKT